KPFWWNRISEARRGDARALLAGVEAATEALCTARSGSLSVAVLARQSVEALEALGRDEQGSVGELYRGDAGDALAAFLRNLVGATVDIELDVHEWPDVLAALMAGASVKPSVTGDQRVAIWGALEARLQSVDTLV